MTNTWNEQEPFFRSQYDRFRLIELLFEKERKAAGLTHEKLAGACGTPYVKPYHLTMIQNLTRTIDDPRHQIDRGRILMALTWGLRLPMWKVDLVLALFDGTPLTPGEFERYLVPYEAGSFVEWDGAEQLRLAALRAMNEVLAARWSRNEEPTSVNVSILNARLDSPVVRERALLEMERQPGMRLVARAEPSTITFPPPTSFEDWSPGQAGLWESGETEEERRERYEITIARHEVFLDHLQRYGSVGIHSRPTFERLLRQAGRAESARRQLERLTMLLWRYDGYSVVLADATPSLELKIIGLDWASMTGVGASLFGWESWPVSVHWNDPKAVLMFANDFWENYYRIEPSRREKNRVIDELCELAELPHPRERAT